MAKSGAGAPGGRHETPFLPSVANRICKLELRLADMARIIEVIEPEVKALGFDLVRVKFMGAEAGDGEKALQIMLDQFEQEQGNAAITIIRFNRK